MNKATTAPIVFGVAALVIGGAATSGAVLGAQKDTAAASPTVPGEFAPFVMAGGQACEAVDAPLLAGVLDASSGFDTDLTGGAGQQGPAQFLPETWDVMGSAVDDDGHMADMPGSGDPRDPGDATMALARLLCVIDEHQAEPRAAGDIAGDRTDLMLAAHVAGEQAVLDADGVPPYAEVTEFLEAVDAATEQHSEGL